LDARLVDVKTDGGAVFAELHCKWQADIAQADDGDGFVLQVHGGFGEIFRACKKFFNVEFLSGAVAPMTAVLLNAHWLAKMPHANQNAYLRRPSA
jgi:hypothetical protein